MLHTIYVAICKLPDISIEIEPCHLDMSIYVRVHLSYLTNYLACLTSKLFIWITSCLKINACQREKLFKQRAMKLQVHTDGQFNPPRCALIRPKCTHSG